MYDYHYVCVIRIRDRSTTTAFTSVLFEADSECSRCLITCTFYKCARDALKRAHLDYFS